MQISLMCNHSFCFTVNFHTTSNLSFFQLALSQAPKQGALYQSIQNDPLYAFIKILSKTGI